MRAAVENVKSGHIVQGGSTITQQLVRNLYIGKEVSLDRKIKEACLAQKVEDAHTKDWILASYLNQVYFGNHAYGVEAAAQTYFSKHAADLNLVQAALIAGLPQAPSIYDPFQRPAEAASRRNEVLGAMYSAGDITAEQYQNAVSAPLKLNAGQHLHADPRAVLLQLRARAADRQVRSEHRARRRPQGLHHDRPALPEARHRRRCRAR